MYYLDHGSYPHGNIGPNNTSSYDGFCIEESQDFKDFLVNGNYISSLPQDPLNNSSQCSSPPRSDCYCYIYRTKTQDKYKLFAKVEQEDFKPAKQDGGVYDTHYEVYASVPGSNQISLAPGWFEGGQYFLCGTDTVTFNYNGSLVTYGTVVGANNECWLDRNLGADPNTDPSEYTGPNDSRGYGDLFQWGRLADGHQIRTSSTTTTLSSTDVPGHSNFILAPNTPYDWRSPQNNDLWLGVNGTNNPCPSGWRIPTGSEWNNELLSWSSKNSTGAFASPLKLTTGGMRNPNNGGVSYAGNNGYYWGNVGNGPWARDVEFLRNSAYLNQSSRSCGHSLRCIKD